MSASTDVNEMTRFKHNKSCFDWCICLWRVWCVWYMVYTWLLFCLLRPLSLYVRVWSAFSIGQEESTTVREITENTPAESGSSESDDEGDSDNDLVDLLSSERFSVDSDDPATGHMEIARSGRVVLTWSNSYSWINEKKLT